MVLHYALCIVGVALLFLLQATVGFMSSPSPITRRSTTTADYSSSPASSSLSSWRLLALKKAKYDLVVIGAGVAGVQAGLIASQAPYNKKVLIVDAPSASGKLMVNNEDLSLGAPTGLFSKALRDTSKRIKVAALRGMGLRQESVWNEIISSCVDLAQSNSQDIRRQITFAGVDLMEGLASFPDGGGTKNILVTNGDVVETIATEKILICTGSQPFRPGGIPFDGKRIFDSDSINGISFLPRSMAITGSGIIAVEFAKIFRCVAS